MVRQLSQIYIKKQAVPSFVCDPVQKILRYCTALNAVLYAVISRSFRVTALRYHLLFFSAHEIDVPDAWEVYNMLSGT